MEYEAEDGASGSVPECGAIFMANASTKRECLGRRLFGLPSGQANFVKHVKSGMILFLFEFESKKLYGVFRACSDGTLNIVPQAFSSSGMKFPAQVCFTLIWPCSPLSEYEFRDAIKENYYSKKKFNFGLSEDQVHRLLQLFNSRKLEKPRRQLTRQGSKTIGEDRRVLAGNDMFFHRNRADEFVEDEDLVPAVYPKYRGNTPSNIEMEDDDRFFSSDVIENELNMNHYHRYNILTEHPRASLGRSERSAEDSQLLLRDQVETKCGMDRNIGRIVTPEYPGNYLAKIKRATNDGRSPMRDIVRVKRTPDNVFALAASSNYLENPAIEARSVIPMDYKVENVGNFDNYPEPDISADHNRPNSLGKRRTRDDWKLVTNNRAEIERKVDNGIQSILSPDYCENPWLEVNEETENCKFLMNDWTENPTNHLVNHLDYERRANDCDRFLARSSMKKEHNVDNGLGPVTVHSRFPMDNIRRTADEGRFLGIDRGDSAHKVENCFGPSMGSGPNNLYQSVQTPALYSSKPILETHYSLCQDQPKPRSRVFEFPYPTSREEMVTRSVPYDPEVPDLHHGRSSSIGVDRTSHSGQDFPPHESSLGNFLESSSKRSSPYKPLEAENPTRHLDDAYGFLNKVLLHTNHNHYTRTSSSLLSAEYYGKAEPQATGHEVNENSQFSGSALAIPYSMSKIFGRQKMDPSFKFEKHVVPSQGGYEHKIPLHDTNQAYGIEDAPFPKTGHLHSGSSYEKYNTLDSEYHQNSKGMHTESKSDRKSVFSRLTSEPRVHEQESDTYLDYDERDVDASVDQVMDMLHQSLNHRIPRVKKFPHHVESDRSKIMRMKRNDDVEQVIEENCDQVMKETRVVSFKRRSETKKNKDGNRTISYVENGGQEKEGSFLKREGKGSDGKQSKHRKLVRPVFGKKVLLNEGLRGDGNSNPQLSSLESPSKQNKERCDDSVGSRENENRSSRNARSVQLTSPTGCEGNKANTKQISQCREKNSKDQDSGTPVFGFTRDRTPNFAATIS